MTRTQTFPALDRAAVHAIGALFETEPRIEPYTPDGEPVYRLALAGAGDGVQVVLWPSLARVDVSSTNSHAWVLKNVGAVDVIDGVEVVFRPSEGKGFLFVAVNGFVNMVMG
ncbi:MAG TPA: hypothetical protein VN697_01190 [Tepidiformaceae bacterium]|nr:hypothetical protein [Tepidiformaceae bacterium]